MVRFPNEIGRIGSNSVFEGLVARPYWLDHGSSPRPRPRLRGEARADLVIIGGGLTGLWTALRALERAPGRSVVLLESGTLANAASGRNGGFVEASLTHGIENGLRHFPDELAALERLGVENLEGIAQTIESEGIECDFWRSGSLAVATADWQRVGLAESAAAARRFGAEVELLEAPALRARLDSPSYRGALRVADRCALVDPARLAWGLAASIERRGGIVYEASTALRLESGRAGPVRVETASGVVIADHVALATSAFPPLVRRIRRYVLPVYDYVIATEPVPEAIMASIGWRGREGVSDLGNRFHYYRRLPSGGILFGGYDAIYHFNNAVSPDLESRPATFRRLAAHLGATFPQLEGVAITHAWGGAIDTCSRFCAFFDTAHRGRVAYAAGFTGLGVGASRFAGDVLLDLLAEKETERSTLRLVRSKPVPFPPEPLRSLVVAATTRSLARADEHDGGRNAWLRLLDALGVGFDS